MSTEVKNAKVVLSDQVIRPEETYILDNGWVKVVESGYMQETFYPPNEIELIK